MPGSHASMKAINGVAASQLQSGFLKSSLRNGCSTNERADELCPMGVDGPYEYSHIIRNRLPSAARRRRFTRPEIVIMKKRSSQIRDEIFV